MSDTTKILIVSDCRLVGPMNTAYRPMASKSFVALLRSTLRQEATNTRILWQIAMVNSATEIPSVVAQKLTEFEAEIVVIDCVVNDFLYTFLPTQTERQSTETESETPSPSMREKIKHRFPWIWQYLRMIKAMLPWLKRQIPRISIRAYKSYLQEGVTICRTHNVQTVILVTPFAPDRIRKYSSPVLAYYSRPLQCAIAEVALKQKTILSDLYSNSMDMAKSNSLIGVDGNHLSELAHQKQAEHLKLLLQDCLSAK